MKRMWLMSIIALLSSLPLSYADDDGFDEMTKDLKGKTKAIMMGVAKSDVEVGIPMGLDLYYIDNGAYPTTQEGLKALMAKPDSAVKWNGPYLRDERKLLDPWGKPYGYKHFADTDNYIVYSLGPDGKEGTQDDIVYQEIVTNTKEQSQ